MSKSSSNTPADTSTGEANPTTGDEVTMADPDGKTYVASGPVEVTNLLAAGYTIKKK